MPGTGAWNPALTKIRVVYHDGSEIFFPYFVPVLVFDFLYRGFDTIVPGEKIEYFQPGDGLCIILFGRNVGRESLVGVGETIVTDSTQFGN